MAHICNLNGQLSGKGKRVRSSNSPLAAQLVQDPPWLHENLSNKQIKKMKGGACQESSHISNECSEQHISSKAGAVEKQRRISKAELLDSGCICGFFAVGGKWDPGDLWVVVASLSTGGSYSCGNS